MAFTWTWWHVYALAVTFPTLMCVLLAVFQLLTTKPRPEIAKFYVRFVLLPAFYSVTACASLFGLLRYAHFFGIVRYLYEAYALYLYALLLLSYAGGEAHSAHILKRYANAHSDGVLTCCSSPFPSKACAYPSAQQLVTAYKWQCWQYIPVKAAVEIAIAFWDFYATPTPKATQIVGVRLIGLASLLLLMRTLIVLYLRLTEPPKGAPDGGANYGVRRFSPLAKIVVVKVVVFVVVTQEFVLNFCLTLDFIRPYSAGGVELTAAENSARWLAILIVTEMLGTAILFFLYFGPEDLRIRGLNVIDTDRCCADGALFNPFDLSVPIADADLTGHGIRPGVDADAFDADDGPDTAVDIRDGGSVADGADASRGLLADAKRSDSSAAPAKAGANRAGNGAAH